MKGLRGWVVLSMLACNYFACTKHEMSPAPVAEDPFISEAITYLREHISGEDFDAIDLVHHQLIKVGAGKHVVRFFDRQDHERSVTIVKTENGLTGNWLKMLATRGDTDETWKTASLDGSRESEIRMSNRMVVGVNTRVDGKERRLTLKSGSRNMFVSQQFINGKYNPDDEKIEWLPEFVVVGYSSRDLTPFYSLFWLTDMNSAFIRSFVPGSIEFEPGGGGSGSGPGSVELATFQFDDGGKRVRLKEMMKCFDNVPSAGAKYSMTLYCDIPVNNDPSELLDGLTPGHAFISLSKSNGENTVTQIFGFYPLPGTLTVFNIPVGSVIVDNGGHEFNASIAMPNIQESRFNAAQKLAINYSESKDYDLNDYNCTNFALDIFNQARSDHEQIEIPDWHGTFANVNYGPTPNGLYNFLKQKKIEKGNESTNITLGNFLAGLSKGVCK